MRNRLPSILASLTAAGAMLLLLAATALAAPMNFTADLSGEADGSGTAVISIDPDTGEVCWELTAEGIGDVTASHIHVGAEGEEGDVAVPLDVDGFSGTSEGCVDASDADLQAIVDDPAGYYVNLHTEEFPAGAIRGQLVAGGEPPDTAMAQPGGVPVGMIGLALLLMAAAASTRLALRRS